MKFSTVFFDLDDTLYDSRNGLWNAIKARIGKYMVECLGMDEATVHELRRHYYLTYGTTLRGLQKHHAVDAGEFLAYVHDLPLEQYLQPAPQKREMILSMPQKRWIFTNADSAHARRVLAHLQLSDCFEGIIDIHGLGFVCKPEPAAFRLAIQTAGNPPAEACVMLDDALANLSGARQAGMTTVWISQNGDRHPDAQYKITDILDLPQVLPELWQGQRD